MEGIGRHRRGGGGVGVMLGGRDTRVLARPAAGVEA